MELGDLLYCFILVPRSELLAKKPSLVTFPACKPKQLPLTDSQQSQPAQPAGPGVPQAEKVKKPVTSTKKAASKVSSLSSKITDCKCAFTQVQNSALVCLCGTM